MWPLIDPRNGDFESDASSSQSRSLWSIAGGMLAEISLPKLIVAWFVLLGLPALLLGAMPIVASIWINATTLTLVELTYGLVPLLLLIALAATALLGASPALPAGRAQLLVAELAGRAAGLCALSRGPEPDRRTGAATGRDDGETGEVARHNRHRVRLDHLSRIDRHPSAGLAACPFCGGILRAHEPVALAEGRACQQHRHCRRLRRGGGSRLVGCRCDDARDVRSRALRGACRRRALVTNDWRVAHLSDIHVVGEKYRISHRMRPVGSPRQRSADHESCKRLDDIQAEQPLHAILVTGDITDAGLATEWAEFFDALSQFPRVAQRMLLIPGNHDINVVNRANPAQFDLPTSPNKKLRKLRVLSALNAIQGSRVRVLDRRQQAAGRDARARTQSLCRGNGEICRDRKAARLS